jgi:hypothetical protein
MKFQHALCLSACALLSSFTYGLARDVLNQFNRLNYQEKTIEFEIVKGYTSQMQVIAVSYKLFVHNLMIL